MDKRKIPKISYLGKDANGDRITLRSPLHKFITNVLKGGNILTPSFNVYMSHKKKVSLLGDFTIQKKIIRSRFKKKALAYQVKGLRDEYRMNITWSDAEKKGMNSISGGLISNSTSLSQPSGHNVLTSVVRTMTSTSNLITESMVGGNRYYSSPEIIKAHIGYLLATINTETVAKCIEQYSLHIPSVDECMLVIITNSENYWDVNGRGKCEVDVIKSVISKLTDLERVYFVYNNSMYNTRLYNDQLLRDMLTPSSVKSVELVSNPLEVLRTVSESTITTLHALYSDDIKGMDVQYDKLELPLLNSMAATAKAIEDNLYKYKLLISTFYITDCTPPQGGFIKNMIRVCVPVSDTDSTCCSYGEWVDWFYNGREFTDSATGFSAGVLQLNTGVSRHYLNMLARNMNISVEERSVLDMKTEFFWDVFAITRDASKHYYANTKIREGGVFEKPILERKGVHLIAGKAAPIVKEGMLIMIDSIFKDVTDNLEVDITKYMKMVSDIEQKIYDGIMSLDYTVLKTEKIQSADGYTKGEDNALYYHHHLWNEVFAPKYGITGPTPYVFVKLNTVLSNKTKIQLFIDGVKDESVKTRLKQYLTKHPKDKLEVLRLPLHVIESKGIPEEVKSIINTNKIIFDNCNPLYTLLETLGNLTKYNTTINNF